MTENAFETEEDMDFDFNAFEDEEFDDEAFIDDLEEIEEEW